MKALLRCIAAALAVATVAACADDPSAPDLLAGMAQVTSADSTGAPPPSEPTAPGFFRGVVMGYAAGPDTLANAERLPNVSVQAYLYSGTQPVGDAVAGTTSNANGEWQLPSLPGAEYVVTFTTPSGSKYRSGWTLGRTGASSGTHPWWIMLPEK